MQDDALEAALPEDAPAGHEAWQKVKYKGMTDYPYAYFYFETQRFQTTLAACRTEEATKRVARACFFMYSQGHSSQHVSEFRKDVYAEIKRISDSARPADRASAAAGRRSTATGAEAASASRGPPGTAFSGSPPAAAPGPAGAGVAGAAAATAGALEDAPEGHAAWDKVYVNAKKGVVALELASLKGHKDHKGKVAWFQTTAARCGGSVEHACRIARLCYVKLADGATIKDAEAYRSALYDALRGLDKPGEPNMLPSGPQEAKRKPAPSKETSHASVAKKRMKFDPESLVAVQQELQAQGRLGGSLLLAGRSLEKKNASINGVYARRAEEHNGRGAYEKVGVEGDPRFLYHCSKKARWKIDNKMPSNSSGFAYLKTTAKTPADAGPDQQWHICDKRGEGYNKDSDVLCTELAPHIATFSTKPGGGAGDAGDSTSSEASDHQSSSASSGETLAQAEDPVEAAPARASAGESQKGPPRSALRAGACAKMLCRSGLRCACHFFFAWECPTRSELSEDGHLCVRVPCVYQDPTFSATR